MQASIMNTKPPFDPFFEVISDYVCQESIESDTAWETARYCLLDALSCGILALNHKPCTNLLGPTVPGTIVPLGARVPGTPYVLDPVKAAFDLGTMIRWLDFNDTWLAAEWGHPSDNLGGILTVADYVSRRNEARGIQPIYMKTVMESLIKAYEIQGVLALNTSFNRIGYDHVALVKLASAAVIMPLLGGDNQAVMDVLSQCLVDGQSLRTYRHRPNTGSRKSWAAGDATSRAVRLCWLTNLGEQGYPSALTVPEWGFESVYFDDKALQFAHPLESYVMENILFKIAFPAEFHGQTAVECALKLHNGLDSIEQIESIDIETQEAGNRIINKVGPLHNYADRDHSIQYMVAYALINGKLTAESYSDEAASDSRIDKLRDIMTVTENASYSQDYLNPDKRSIPNRIKLTMKDGSTKEESMEYPLGHRQRRDEGIPLLEQKIIDNLATQYTSVQTNNILSMCDSWQKLSDITVHEFVDQWVL